MDKRLLERLQHYKSFAEYHKWFFVHEIDGGVTYLTPSGFGVHIRIDKKDSAIRVDINQDIYDPIIM